MPSLPILLKKLAVLHREITRVEEQIIAVGKPAPKRGRKRSTNTKTIELIRALVKVLQDAGEPLPRREIAARLGIAPPTVSYRLQRAMAAKFVEKVSGGRYRVSPDVPAL